MAPNENTPIVCSACFSDRGIRLDAEQIGSPLTPVDVHHGVAEQRLAARGTVLARAYTTHPERLPAGLPHPPARPIKVWINLPRTRATEDSRARGGVLDHARCGQLPSTQRPDLPRARLLGGSRMTCPRCQQDNPPHARFCLGCGGRLALPCAACGAELPAGARFCLQCGHAVPAGPAPARAPAPETYTPKHLAEKILTSRAALEGERKQVTVLFADLKGSMELLADRDPEEARKLLDPVLELMMEAVHRYEGTVNQVMGDGIMALFGAPLAHEDHAVRACYAALRM